MPRSMNSKRKALTFLINPNAIVGHFPPLLRADTRAPLSHSGKRACRAGDGQRTRKSSCFVKVEY